ncbi:MFS transporter [Marinithermofilum abyssi]|nr:MFS transporter [Marinithermofilum abyssi]
MTPEARWRRNFWMLWFGQFVAIAGLTVVVPLLPFYMEMLGATDPVENRWWTGICLAAPALTLFLVSPVWGRIGDKWGRKWMVVRALLGLSASIGLMGWAQTPVHFLLFRLLQGACGGVVDAAAAFAGSDAPAGKRGRVFGNLQSATAAGSLAGPLIGGVLADGWGYRPLFWLMGGLTALSALLAAAVLVEPRPSEQREKQRGTETPMRQVFGRLMSDVPLRGILLAGVCAQAGVFGLVAVFAPLVRDLAGSPHYAATWVGVLQAVTWGGTILGAPWWGRRNDRSPLENNFFWAAVGCGVSVLLQVIPQQLLWLIPLRFIQGFCFSALLQSVFLKVTRRTPASDRGASIGMTNSFLVFGQVLGSFLAAVAGGALSVEWTCIVMGLLFLAGAWLVKHPPAFRWRLPETGLSLASRSPADVRYKR